MRTLRVEEESNSAYEENPFLLDEEQPPESPSLISIIIIAIMLLSLLPAGFWVQNQIDFLLDSDGDGVPNSEDKFPYDATESSDWDGDGFGDNIDPDDDNDGYSDNIDLDPLYDLSVVFNFNWVNLSTEISGRPMFFFQLYQEEKELKQFDEEGSPFEAEWQVPYDLSIDFEVNVPDIQSEHSFNIRLYQAQWSTPQLLDIDGSNDTYGITISYNLINETWSGDDVDGLVDGALDNLTDEPDAQMSYSISTSYFGYVKTYMWSYGGKEYEMSYNFDPTIYASYVAQDHRITDEDDYIEFATPDDETMILFSEQLHRIAQENALSVNEEAQYLLSFVQSLKYAEDNVTAGLGEYPRFPVETLVDELGDCEDTSILLITIAEILGIDSALILIPDAFPDAGHAAVGLALDNISGTYYELDGTEYFYSETTAVGWQIGEIPDMDSSTAILYTVP